MAKKIEGAKRPKVEPVKCAVCMEKNAYASISCTHKFCMRCISRWTKVTSVWFRGIRLAHSAELRSMRLDTARGSKRWKSGQEISLLLLNQFPGRLHAWLGRPSSWLGSLFSVTTTQDQDSTSPCFCDMISINSFLGSSDTFDLLYW